VRMASAEAKRNREAKEAALRASAALERERASAERAWQKAERLEALQKAAEGEKLTAQEEKNAAQVAAKAEREWRERNEVLRRKREEEDLKREEVHKIEREATQMAAAETRHAAQMAAAEARQMRVEEEAARKLEEAKNTALEAKRAAEIQHKVEMDEAKLRQRIIFAGVNGYNAPRLNGAFVPTGEMFNGKPLYTKETDPALRLYFLTGKSKWSVLAEDNAVLLESFEPNVELPTLVKMWNVNCGLNWIVQSKVTCVLSHPELATAALSAPVANVPATAVAVEQIPSFRVAPTAVAVAVGVERRTSVHSTSFAASGNNNNWLVQADRPPKDSVWYRGVSSTNWAAAGNNNNNNWLVQAEPTSVMSRTTAPEKRTMVRPGPTNFHFCFCDLLNAYACFACFYWFSCMLHSLLASTGRVCPQNDGQRSRNTGHVQRRGASRYGRRRRRSSVEKQPPHADRHLHRQLQERSNARPRDVRLGQRR